VGKVLSFIRYSRVGRNLLYLYLVQGANYLFPLLTLPYLTRTLGPQGFGLLAVGQSMALYLQLLVEYGFSFSGTREVARHREDPGALARIFSGVLAAKLFLLLPAFLLALTALYLPVLRGREDVVFSAFFWAAAWGLSPLWVFQGLERMREVALLEVLTRGLATMGVFLLVRAPEQAYLPLFLNGVGALAASGLGFFWLSRHIPLRRPSLRESLLFLAMGKDLFFFRVAVSLYTAANPLILSFFAPPSQVGLYAGAERLTKAVLGMVEPFNRAFFPRFSHEVGRDTRGAGRMATLVFALMVGFAMGGAFFLWFVSPWVVHILLGPGYEGAVPIMRILVLLLPLIAASNLLGLQWMLAWKMDRAFNAIIVVAGFLNLLLATALSHLGGASGLAWAVVLVEAFVTGGMVWYLHRLGRLPWEVAR